MSIKALREKKRLTQHDLARELGVDVNTLWRWENGQRVPSHKNALKLAGFFNCTLDEIYQNPTRPLSGKATKTRRAGAGMEAAVSAGA